MSAEKPRSEREAICASEPDVTAEEARAIAECESAAELSLALGEQPSCTCGAGHVWGPS